MKQSPLAVGAIALVGACIAQVFRLTRDGWSTWAAVGSVLAVAVATAAFVYLMLVIAGARNRRLLDILSGEDTGTPVFAVYYSRELHTALECLELVHESSRAFNKHGAVQVGQDGLRFWVTRKGGPVMPTRVARLPWERVLFADGAAIEIDGHGHPGLSISIWSGAPSETVELEFGVASRRFGAFFPSRRGRAECLQAVQSRISEMDHRAARVNQQG